MVGLDWFVHLFNFAYTTIHQYWWTASYLNFLPKTRLTSIAVSCKHPNGQWYREINYSKQASFHTKLHFKYEGRSHGGRWWKDSQSWTNNPWLHDLSFISLCSLWNTNEILEFHRKSYISTTRCLFKIGSQGCSCLGQNLLRHFTTISAYELLGENNWEKWGVHIWRKDWKKCRLLRSDQILLPIKKTISDEDWTSKRW